MITMRDRRLILALVRLRLFRIKMGFFRCYEIEAKPCAKWLHRWLLRRQKLDDTKHAPCCPANHWCGKKLVFQRCNCGAVR